MTPPTEETLEKMLTYGGNFVRRLALLYQAADETNKDKILNAFYSYFDQYETFQP